MARPARRPGYTLLELLCVIAVLVILGAVILPSLDGMNRDTRVVAAADMARGWCSEARARAIDDGRTYQLFASPDGRRLRIAPDELEQAEQPAGGQAPPALIREEPLPDAVTLVPMQTGDEQASAGGWLKLATFRPDGTCREPAVRFELLEPGVTGRVVTIRGMTGAVTVNLATQSTQTGGRLP
jgi:prepilin-type N-terminal cleavage/methylation domain-containing protein